MTMQAYRYQPRKFSINRFSHRLAGLLRPEARLQPLSLGILISQQVRLADTSIYDSLVDIDKMISGGIQGVIPKASQGISEDVQFRNTWTNAKDKLRRGCYLFYDPRFKPSAQVDKFVSLIQDDSGELPLVIDWEYGDNWGGNYQGWQNLYNCLEALKAAMPGRKIFIYTGYYYWLDHSPNPITQAASLNYFSQYGLWLAWYTTDFSVIRIPKPWNNLTFLQYTDNGDREKYGALDLDYYAGTQEEFETEFPFGGATPPAPFPVILADGIIHYQGNFNGVNYQLVNFDLAKVKWIFDDNPDDHLPLVRVADWHPEALVAINGGGYMEFNNYGVPFGICANNGHVYANMDRNKPELSFFVLSDGRVVWDNEPFLPYSAVNYPEKLITGGVKRMDLNNMIADPRTMMGLKDNVMYWFKTEPMTQQASADLCESHGLAEANENDGGKNAAMRIAGEMVGGGAAPAVPTHIGIIPKGAIVMTQVIQGTVKQIVKVKNAPAGADVGYSLAVGTKIEASENSNQWLHLTKVNDVPVSGAQWVSSGTNQAYISWEWVTVDVEPPPPPPPPPPANNKTVDFIIHNDDGTIDAARGVPLTRE